MNGVQTRFKCKLDVKRCKRFVFPPSSLLPRSNALKTKAIRYFQTDRTLTRIVSPPLHIIQQRLGLLKGTTAGEGAQFFLLSAQEEEQTFAELKGVDTFITRMSAPEISNRMHHFLKSHGLAPEDIDWFISGKNGQEATDSVYTELEHSLFPHALHSSFKEQCGEYQTASSYALWMAAKALKEEASSRYALIYNQYQGINHSIILIKRCTS